MWEWIPVIHVLEVTQQEPCSPELLQISLVDHVPAQRGFQQEKRWCPRGRASYIHYENVLETSTRHFRASRMS